VEERAEIYEFMAILGSVRTESCPLETKVTFAIISAFFKQKLSAESWKK
jgi:hypothetical protein